MKIQGRLISSHRYLNDNLVRDKALRFTVFIVDVIQVTLRGKQYTLQYNGHHNYAAAKLIGTEQKFRTPKKLAKTFNQYTQSEKETFVINNLTDSDLYDVDTDEVIQELLHPDMNNGIFQNRLTNGLRLYQ